LKEGEEGGGKAATKRREVSGKDLTDLKKRGDSTFHRRRKKKKQCLGTSPTQKQIGKGVRGAPSKGGGRVPFCRRPLKEKV